ncbi:MAG: leucine-rich repeat domain-containing protein [Lachnospiraceae bacterium]|nr:leucine-rich repeat domain-containing protein [Lachnospiraceae bacterium]
MKKGAERILFALLMIAIWSVTLCGKGNASSQANVVEEGDCGDDATYTVSGTPGNYTLTISGSGDVDEKPWITGENYNNGRLYRTTIVKVVVEENIETLPEECFVGLQSLTDVTLPDSLVGIPRRGFASCTSLESIDCGEAKIIEPYAFEGCSSLKNVTCNFVKDIEPCAFKDSGLLEFTVPASIVNADNLTGYSFAGCSKLTSIKCASGQKVFKSVSGILYSKDGTRLVAVPAKKPGTLTIPSSVTKIDTYACYENKSITSVVIPDTVITIESKAFYGCTKLATVDMADSVLLISKDAFPSTQFIPSHFTLNGSYYRIFEDVTIKVTEQYDLANQLLQVINANRASQVKLNTTLCDSAMLRAAECAVYADATSPIRPDGSRFSSSGECVAVVVMENVTAQNLYNAFTNANKRKLTNAKGIGIGVVETAGRYYCVVEIQNSAGTATSYKSGTAAKIVPITYAKDLVPNAQLIHTTEPDSTAGMPCETRLYFGNGEAACEVDPSTVAFVSKNTAVVAVDEAGQLYAIKAGTADVVAKLGRLSCQYTVTVKAGSSQSPDNAIITHACVIGDSFGIKYAVPKSVCDSYSDFYLTITKPHYEGNKIVSYENAIIREYSQETIESVACYVFRYNGIAAKEMTSEIKASLTGTKNGKVYIHKEDTYSIGQYAQDMLASSTASAKLKTALVDMLTYGGKAQEYFNYHKSASAASLITSAAQQYGTPQSSVTVSSSQYSEASSGAEDWFLSGFSLSLDNKVTYYFYLNGTKEALYEIAEVTIGTQVISIPAEDWQLIETGTYRIAVTGINPKEARTPVSIIVKKNGTNVSNGMTVSMEIYAALAAERSLKSADLAKSLVGFGDSLMSFLN